MTQIGCEHRSGERFSESGQPLPGLQQALAHKILSLETPVVLVLVNGGQVALDEYLFDGPAAIVEAFNPNDIDGTALA